jgi:hypothetical protein
MTALIDRTVKRTFSVGPEISTGLPGFQARQPGRKELGDFREAIARVLLMKEPRWHVRRVGQKDKMSSFGKEVAKAIESRRKKWKTKAVWRCAQTDTWLPLSLRTV